MICPNCKGNRIEQELVKDENGEYQEVPCETCDGKGEE